MNEQKTTHIKIIDLINTDRAISSENGIKLFDALDESLSKNEMVILDFSGLELLLSVFLNASIGQLYSKFDTHFIDTHLKADNISDDDLTTLKKVISRAQEYFSDESHFENSANPHFPDA